MNTSTTLGRPPHLALSLPVLFALAACGTAPGADKAIEMVGASLSIDTNATYTIVGVQSNRCVDVKDGSTANGATIQIYDCNGTTAQQFKFEAMDSGYYRIHNVNSGKCVDVSGAQTNNGASIIQWDCHTGYNQQWSVSDVSSGVQRLTVRHTGDALDVFYRNTANGSSLAQWPWNGGNNQQFMIKSTSSGGSSSGGSSSGGSSGATVPPLTSYSTGTTTRYWDCCKPSCGWTANAAQGGKNATKTCGADGTSQVSVDTQSACSGGSGYQCYSMAPWSVSDTLSYGYAATGNGNPMCGKCFQLDFTGAGDNGNASALKGKSMIVQIINIGGDVASTQFDLLIPGGGVGQFNACSNEWGTSDLGAQYGGFLSGCNGDVSCVTNKCQQTFGNKPDLLAGCQWFTGWFNGASNPRINYAEVACPQALGSKSGM